MIELVWSCLTVVDLTVTVTSVCHRWLSMVTRSSLTLERRWRYTAATTTYRSTAVNASSLSTPSAAVSASAVGSSTVRMPLSSPGATPPAVISPMYDTLTQQFTEMLQSTRRRSSVHRRYNHDHDGDDDNAMHSDNDDRDHDGDELKRRPRTHSVSSSDKSPSAPPSLLLSRSISGSHHNQPNNDGTNEDGNNIGIGNGADVGAMNRWMQYNAKELMNTPIPCAINRYVCDRILPSFTSASYVKHPSWRHRLIAQQLLWARWRNPMEPPHPLPTPPLTISDRQYRRYTRQYDRLPYTMYHKTDLGEVSSWSLMVHDRYLAHLCNGHVIVTRTDHMNHITSDDDMSMTVPTIKLPTPTPQQHGWTAPLAPGSAWLCMSFGSCLQLANIITHDTRTTGLVRNVPSRSLVCVDGHTSQPMAYTYGRPHLEEWDLQTMTVSTPLPPDTLNGGPNVRMSCNDSHSALAIADLDHCVTLIDRRSYTTIDSRPMASSNLQWRDNLLIVGGPNRSYLFDVRRGLSHPVWCIRDNRNEFVALDVNPSNGMMVFHYFFANETDLFDLYRLHDGVIRTWTNPCSHMSQPMVTHDRFYLLGYHDAIVYDFGRTLPNTHTIPTDTSEPPPVAV